MEIVGWKCLCFETKCWSSNIRNVWLMSPNTNIFELNAELDSHALLFFLIVLHLAFKITHSILFLHSIHLCHHIQPKWYSVSYFTELLCVRYFTRLLVSPNILHRTAMKCAGLPSTAQRFCCLFHKYKYMKQMNESGF